MCVFKRETYEEVNRRFGDSCFWYFDSTGLNLALIGYLKTGGDEVEAVNHRR